ncbi:MAG: hypothetical protein CMO74_03490 [Verrucomicrobiales bacterium]|nr:hypothetical protein [Verrucomicrobiales bacterium]
MGAHRISQKISGKMKWLGTYILGAASVCRLMGADPADVTFFEEKIRPILAEKCYKCHSDRAQKLKGDLKLDSRAAILKGGEEGPSVTVGKPNESLLIKAIRHEIPDLEMPPKEKLPAAVIKDFEQWVARGAVFPEGAKKVDVAWWDRVNDKRLLPKGKSIAEVVDHYVDAKLAANKVKPVDAADDYEFIRRTTLDLAGRIPTVPELEKFVADKAKDKRAKLVDHLMASESFLRHQAIEFNWLLMDKQDSKMANYLTTALKEGRSWDKIFREVILPNQADEKQRDAAVFIKERVKDTDVLTVEVSVKFFGINVSCARCHDHPEVPSWKQDHYYGMKSFFNRTFDNGDFFGEREYGQVSFTTTKGESKKAKLMFLSGSELKEPEAKDPDKKAKDAEKKRNEKFKKDKKPLPVPKFSRRAQLVDAGLKPGDDGFFARSIVNRLWHQMFGHGLVMPLDQLHGANSPSHPELLQWLARDLIEHDYDLRRTIRGLAQSKAYARASRWGDSQRPSPSYFAVAMPRAMTPHQYGASLAIAVQDPGDIAKQPTAEQAKRIAGWEKHGHGWASQFERPRELFQISVDEALYLSNNDRIRRELLAESGKLVGNLLKLKDRRERIEAAWLAALSRKPAKDELNAVEDYLTARDDRLAEAWKQIVWSLLTSAEMRFNH